MRFACIYIPDFPVQAVVRGEPSLRHRAVAVVDGIPPLLAVVALNPKARQAGAETGMAAVQVAQLSAVASVEVRRRSRVQEATARAALLDLGLSFSPRVEDSATDTIVLDLAGLEQLWGSPENIAHHLARRASELELEAHIAVAPNPDAARHAARGFPGITLISAGEETERLGSLPVSVLVPPPDILETLDRWGVHTFKALSALPLGPVSERLGQEGVHLQKLARGTDVRPLVPVPATLHFEEVMELEYPVTLLEPLAFILGRLLVQLCARLATRALATNELRLRLELEKSVASQPSTVDSTTNGQLSTASCFNEPAGNNIHERALSLPVPMRDPKVFLRLLQLNLQSDPPPAPIRKVTVFAEPVKPRVVQGGLFLPLAPDPEKLEVVLARIAAMVGKENVGSPKLLDTHRPGAFQMSRFLGTPESGFGVRQKQTPSLDPQAANPKSQARMALRVFRPPLPATVEVRAGRPVCIFAPFRVRGKVVWAAGPWRTSGGWWAEDTWEQDEWDVEIRRGPSVTTAGGERRGSNLVVPKSASKRKFYRLPLTARRNPCPDIQQRTSAHGQRTALYRIYRDLASGSWFVRGTYD